MGKVRVIEIHEDVFSDNNKTAEMIRSDLNEKGTFLLNVMSSPGSTYHQNVRQFRMKP